MNRDAPCEQMKLLVQYSVLIFLTRGPTLCRVRQKEQISQKLNGLRGKMPSEFARQPRGLEELDRWKAIEFRQF